MGLMSEYIGKNMSTDGYREELLRLIAFYNKKTGHFLLVYSVALSKHPLPISIDMDDCYIISDILSGVPSNKDLDVYLETPGGSGDAAESIVKNIRKKFENVDFVIAGEAKSAGTLLALSGNNIIMTETGSLGPIDAQCPVGRSVVSAHDYMTWIHDKQDEATKKGNLSPFDATMIAQISPGELYGIQNALDFAKDLVIEWLPKYKFKSWTITETNKREVTDEMRKNRAKKIADSLTDHSKWRSHGRSLGITELNEVGLYIDPIVDKDILDTVCRIQVVLRLLFSTSNIYKAFITETEKIFKMASSGPAPNSGSPAMASSVQFGVVCNKCGKNYNLYAKFVNDKEIDKQLQAQGFIELPKSGKITCDCGFEIDLTGARNEIEAQAGRKVL